jgi:uncharacterized membrane-anchored protein
MRKAILPLVGLMVLAQWLLPWWTIRGSERILREGRPFLFRTAPIDPHDPIRGEYVELRFALEDETYPLIDGLPVGGDRTMFITLKEVDGEAAIEKLRFEPPTDGAPYLACAVNTWIDADSNSFAQVYLPFDRFYLEEGTGRRTEELIGDRTWGEGPELPAYALVRVLDGQAVIEDLIVGDRPLREWVE